MALYLVNATKQNHRFQWRMPETSKTVHFAVPSGHQIRVDEGLNSAQIDDMISHFERYGYRKVDDISSKLLNFDGLMYGPKVIKEDDFHTAHDAVVEMQEKRSAAESTRSALGMEKGARDKRNKRHRLAKEVSVEIVQHVDQRNVTGNEINMSLTVAEDGSTNVRLPS